VIDKSALTKGITIWYNSCVSLIKDGYNI